MDPFRIVGGRTIALHTNNRLIDIVNHHIAVSK